MAAWKTVKLSEVCEIQRGGSPRPIENFITEADNGINWIKIGDVAEGAKYITSTKERIKPEGAQRSRAVQEGDFLLSNSMSFGRPYILKTSGCIHDGWLVLRYDKEMLTEDFLYHVLGSDFVYTQFVKFAVGAVVKNLNSEVVKQVSIPLPPLEEQRRIAAILDQADALRAKRREALAQIDSLTQSIFIEMFGKKNCIQTAQLGNVVSMKRGPFGGALKKEIFVPEGPMVYEQRNAIYDDCLTGRYFISEEKFKEMEDFAVIPNDLIVSCSGTIGKVAVAPHNAPKGIINQALLRIRVDANTVSSIYLKHALESEEIQNQLTGLSHGTGLQNFPPMSEVKALEIPLPSIERQRAFEAQLHVVDKQKDVVNESAAELGALFASLQHSAFRGEL